MDTVTDNVENEQEKGKIPVNKAKSDAELSDMVLTAEGQACLRSLLRVWFEFERELSNVPIVQRLESDRLSKSDYLLLLLNMRQQVIEGSRWITRCASSFDRDYADVRSEVIGHAYDEHRDYEVLEQDFINAGGRAEEITSARRNTGSEALHGFMMYRASRPNPVDMIGAMWIIEGIGNKMANQWAERVSQLFATDNTSKFMSYHGQHDGEHMEELYRLIDRVCHTEDHLYSITRTAKVVARLYLLQLEEIDHEITNRAKGCRSLDC